MKNGIIFQTAFNIECGLTMAHFPDHMTRKRACNSWLKLLKQRQDLNYDHLIHDTFKLYHERVNKFCNQTKRYQVPVFNIIFKYTIGRKNCERCRKRGCPRTPYNYMYLERLHDQRETKHFWKFLGTKKCEIIFMKHSDKLWRL